MMPSADVNCTPHAVVFTKSSGRVIEFAKYPTLQEADRVATLLRDVGERSARVVTVEEAAEFRETRDVKDEVRDVQ